ncbi:hypothetical protein Kyoto44A_07010 [Helicobacter pylori]
MAVRFGVIFITSNSDNPIDIDNKTKKLESCFRDAIKHPFYCPFTIEDYLILDNLKNCFVFQNKPNVTLFDNDLDDIQYKEGVALDYALINDIKHNLLDNTFHFIFDIDLHLIDD